MISDSIPTGGRESDPLFAVGKSAFWYRVNYKVGANEQIMQYNSIHELILSMSSFKDTDKVTYVSREDDLEFIAIPISEVKLTISKSLYCASQEDLELLYLRLLLTNKYSPRISDKGRYLQLDFTLRRYLTTLRAGRDNYLSNENGQPVLYLKYRRYSTVHLLATITEFNDRHNIHFYHFNIPLTMANQELMAEVLKLKINSQQFRFYRYNPIPGADNDVIVPTDIRPELIQVFNQLLK